MTRKHYEAIARIIKAQRSRQTSGEYDAVSIRACLDAVADDMADYMASENKQFDRARFIKACGISQQQEVRSNGN